jgi:pyruvate dehydrogenase E2 component (dihydrolipoamide acetyltransferase)
MAEGDEVEVDSEVVEISSDKIVQALESPVAGILRRIIGEEGEDYPIQTLIGIIADADVSDEEIDAFIASYGGASTPGADAEAPDVERTGADDAKPETKDLTASSTRPLSKMRAAIAKTVVASWSIPQFPVTVAIDMGAVRRLRAERKEAGQAVTMTDIITKACARAMAKYPMINAGLGDKEFILHPQVNIAIAVAADDDLMMPVIKGCEALSLEEVAAASSQLIGKIRDGSIGVDDLSGANFAISNLGMFGVEQFAALVPPGMAAILAVGGIREEAVVINGEVKTAARMRVTLMADHRIVDGLCAARFLGELSRLLEKPEEL